MVLVARTAEPMEELKKQYPEQVEVVVGDLSDFKVGVEDVCCWKFPGFGRLRIDHRALVRTWLEMQMQVVSSLLWLLLVIFELQRS